MPMRGYALMHVHIYVYTPACDARLCDPPSPHLPILWVMPELSLGTCWGKMCFEGKLQNVAGGKSKASWRQQQQQQHNCITVIVSALSGSQASKNCPENELY